MSDLLTAALGHAARGWHVFPLRPDDKRPAFPDHSADDCTGRDPRCRGGHVGWEARATTDPDRIRELLLTHRANTEGMLEDARKAEASAHNNPDEWHYPELVTRFSMRQFEAELQLVDALLAELDT